MNDVVWDKVHVLVIDDEVFMRKLIERTLSDIGIGLITLAADGVEGLMQIKRAGSLVNIVICDLEMPEQGQKTRLPSKQLRLMSN